MKSWSTSLCRTDGSFRFGSARRGKTQASSTTYGSRPRRGWSTLWSLVRLNDISILNVLDFWSVPLNSPIGSKRGNVMKSILIMGFSVGIIFIDTSYDTSTYGWYPELFCNGVLWSSQERCIERRLQGSWRTSEGSKEKAPCPDFVWHL